MIKFTIIIEDSGNKKCTVRIKTEGKPGENSTEDMQASMFVDALKKVLEDSHGVKQNPT